MNSDLHPDPGRSTEPSANLTLDPDCHLSQLLGPLPDSIGQLKSLEVGLTRVGTQTRTRAINPNDQTIESDDSLSVVKEKGQW